AIPPPALPTAPIHPPLMNSVERHGLIVAADDHRDRLVNHRVEVEPFERRNVEIGRVEREFSRVEHSRRRVIFRLCGDEAKPWKYRIFLRPRPFILLDGIPTRR